MKWRRPEIWLGIVSALAVVGLAVSDMDRTSPGSLSTVHGRVPELASGSGCIACHGGWRKSLPESCLECHEDVGEQIEDGRGLHGTLEGTLAKACASCHSEHHGAKAPIVHAGSFRLAGVSDVHTFDHELIGYPLAGRHLELSCVECHEHADAEVLPEGARRYLGLQRDCASCHDDPHEGAMVRDCATCHVQEDFLDLGGYPHDESFPLVGGHAELDCRACHAEGEPRSLEALLAGSREPARGCVECHPSPHAAEFLEGNAELADLSSDASCVECHEAEHATFRVEPAILSAAQHACSGFPLDAPHADVSCQECHQPDLRDFVARFPGREADDCQRCHVDPHAGQFAESAYHADGCLSCHERHRFTPHLFDLEAHRRTRFALTGAHVETGCAECHTQPTTESPRGFAGTDDTCEACHADVHRGFFDEVAATRARPEHGECAHCHDTGSFHSASTEAFAHGDWTGFPLAGAHAQEGCEVCHPRTEHPDEHGRTFGWIEGTVGEVQGCATCHADPHAGSFDVIGMPIELDGRRGCARCHDETSFRALPHGFDHGLWTGYPLEGAHADAACSACHDPLRPAVEGRTWDRAAGQHCADCHADAHAGQFDEYALQGCERCHESSHSFADLSFDHDVHSRFPLDATHAGLSCSECHKPWVLETGVEFVRYKPLGTECSDCHGKTWNSLQPGGGW